MVLKLHSQKWKIALLTVKATICCCNKTRNVAETSKETTVTREKFRHQKTRAKPIKTVKMFGVITVILLL